MSPETLRGRRSTVKNVIEVEYGPNGEDYAVADIVRRKGKEDRAVLLNEMGLGAEISEEEGMAMFVDLGITWNKFRTLKK